ncbi:MAG: helix-turn-helix transcriptional regulator [Spirochaetaceae bacterium]
MMEPIIDYLKVNVKYYRTNKNYTQQELAERSDISTSYVAEIELGRRQPSLQTLLKLSTALEIETYQLLIDPDKHDNDTISKFSEELLKRIKIDINELKSRI